MGPYMVISVIGKKRSQKTSTAADLRKPWARHDSSDSEEQETVPKSTNGRSKGFNVTTLKLNIYFFVFVTNWLK